jgi:peroxiredoxin Q/BCP
MAELQIGDKSPDFCLPDHNGEEVCLNSFNGKWIVLYFYPKDNTPGCTTEAQDFTTHLEEIESLGATVLGISPDKSDTHKRFREKKNIKITLLSDTEKKVLGQYGLWQLKKVCGKECMGVVRTTFIINPEGNIAHIWPKVKVKGHVEDVRQKLAELTKE